MGETETPMESHAISYVTLANGQDVPLSELPCTYCGKVGSTFLAVTEQFVNPFCSWEHLTESVRIDDQPLTEDLMREAGLHIIGPKPEA